jgi:hypothetical protein
MRSDGGDGPVRQEPCGSGDLAGSSVSLVLVGVHAGCYRRLGAAVVAAVLFVKDAATTVGEVVRSVDPARFPLGDRQQRASVQGLRNLGCFPGRYCFSVGFNLSFATGVYCSPVQSSLAMELLQIWGVFGDFDDCDVWRRSSPMPWQSKMAMDFTVTFIFFRAFFACLLGQLSPYLFSSYLYSYGTMYAFLTS